MSVGAWWVHTACIHHGRELYSNLKIYAAVLCQDLISNGKCCRLFPLLWCINAIYYKLVFISTISFSSRETILSAKMSLGHHFMSSVDHSTADAMKPSISKGYHLGSVNSSLVNLYLTSPLPSLFPSCVTLSPHLVSVVIYIHQSSTELAFIMLTAHTPRNVFTCTQGTRLSSRVAVFNSFLISPPVCRMFYIQKWLYTHS